MTRVEYVVPDVDGYCKAWLSPPIITSKRDTPETQAAGDLINEDWKRRCPNEWEAWRASLTE